MKTAAEIFDRYESVRHRLPTANVQPETRDVHSLLDIVDHADAFVFDAYGVLNVGDTAIKGASDRLDQLRARGCKIRILSNAASYDHDGALRKFRNLGMKIDSDEIITSRDAAVAAITPMLWGCIAAPLDEFSDIHMPTRRLGDDPSEYDQVDGFLFLSSEDWTMQKQAYLEQSLLKNPRTLIIANADLAAPRENAFSLEPGHYGHLLADRGIAAIRFLGKPFPEVYGMIENTLSDIAPNRIVMCGDTLHTDIIGAAAHGWRTVLVTHDGLFSGRDTRTYCERALIQPDWRVSRI